jgi:hypothetical protein
VRVLLTNRACTSNNHLRLPKSTLRDDNADDDHSDTDDEAAGPATHYAFPELDAHIRAAIEAYGGGVFPKLNFSSPKARSPLFLFFSVFFIYFNSMRNINT